MLNMHMEAMTFPHYCSRECISLPAYRCARTAAPMEGELQQEQQHTTDAAFTTRVDPMQSQCTDANVCFQRELFAGSGSYSDVVGERHQAV